jgi:streptogramin lyase
LRGGHVEARTDVYALGGVLHHCLTGQVPYPVRGELDAVSAHLLDPPPRPTSVNPLLPRSLDKLMARAMSKDPAERFPSAGDLAKAAEAALRGESAPRQEQSVATGAAAPLRPPRAWRTRRALIAASVGLVVLTAAVVAWIELAGEHHRPGPTADVAVGRVLRVSGTPEALAVAGGAVWTMTVAGGGLQRTDPHTGRSTASTASIDLGGGEFPALVAGAGALWQVQSFDTSGGVTKIDPRSGSSLGRTGIPGATAVVADRGGVWATARRGARGRLIRIDPHSLKAVRASVRARMDPVAVARAADDVWVADRRRDQLLRYDPLTLRLRARLEVGDGPEALASSRDALWVANFGDRTLTHVDPISGEVVGAAVSLGKEIHAIARSPRTLWVAAADATVTRIDPLTGVVRGSSIAVGKPPLSLVADAGGVWVASARDRTVQHLGLANGQPG